MTCLVLPMLTVSWPNHCHHAQHDIVRNISIYPSQSTKPTGSKPSKFPSAAFSNFLSVQTHIHSFQFYLMNWQTAAHQQPTLLVVNICGLPVRGSWSFRAIVWTVLVVGVLLLQARRPGIRCQTVFAIQQWVSTFLGVSWRHTFFA